MSVCYSVPGSAEEVDAVSVTKWECVEDDLKLEGSCLTSPGSLPSFSADHPPTQRPFGAVSACGDTRHRIQILSCLTRVSVIEFWEGAWALLPDCLELKPSYYRRSPYTACWPSGNRELRQRSSRFPFHPHLRFSSYCTQCCSPIPKDSPSVSFKTSSMPLSLLPFPQIALGVEGSGLFSPLPGSLC